MAKTTKENVPTWRVNQLRLTVFPAPDFQDDPKSLWPEIAGLTLDKQTTSPKTGEKIWEGSLENQKVTLTILPVRIDLVITTADVVTLDTVSIPDMGIVEEVFDKFMSIGETWLKHDGLNNLKRIAFGAELFMNVPGLTEAYDEVSKYLPFKVSAEDSSDFRYQINKPVQSKIEDELKLNRLSMWDVLKLNLQLASVADPELTHKYPDLFYCHVSLDINTAPTSDKTFDSDKSILLFKELVSVGKEIAEKGIK